MANDGKYLNILPSGKKSQEEAIESSSGAVDASKIIKTNSDGLIDTSFLGETFESVNQNLKSFDNVLSYTGKNLTSVVYDLGLGLSITKTLAYTGKNLTSITLSGDLPASLTETVKTLSYTGKNLTGVVYS